MILQNVVLVAYICNVLRKEIITNKEFYEFYEFLMNFLVEKISFVSCI